MLITKGNPLEFRGEKDGDLIVPVLLPENLSNIVVVSSNLRKYLCEDYTAERVIYNDYLSHMQQFIGHREVSIAFARSLRLVFLPFQEHLLKDTFLLRKSLSRMIKELSYELGSIGLIFPDIEIELNFIMQEVSKLENRRALFVLDDDRQDLEEKKEGGVMVSGKIC
jgi:hypothetical protein